MQQSTAALFELLGDAVHDAVVFTDAEGTVTFWNEAATRLFGWTAEEMVGRPLLERFPPHARPPVAAQQAAAVAGTASEGEQEDYRKDGSRVWVDTRVRPLRRPDGTVAGVLRVVSDISARRRAERARELESEVLRLALAAAEAGVWHRDIEAQQVKWSPENYRLFGVDPQREVSYEVWKHAVHPEDVPQAEAAITAALRGQAPEFRAEFRVSHPERGLRWLLGVGKVWRNEQGVPTRLTGINFDITERRVALEALRESEARLDRAQHAARLGSWSWEPATGKVWWSRAIHELFQFGPDVQPGVAAFMAAVHPDDRARAAERMEEIKAGADGFADDLRILRPDGTVVWLDSRGQVIRDAAGRVIRVDGTDQDITERKHTEALLRRHSRVLEMIAAGRRLEDVLAEIAAGIEEQLPGALCSVLLVDRDGRLRLGAAPHLPPDFALAANGAPIGPSNGTCGAAASLRRIVEAPDIATDPVWGDYKDLPLAHGLLSSLSVPILASGNVPGVPAGTVLATFGVYWRQAHGIDPNARVMLADTLDGDDAHERRMHGAGSGAAYLARVAIERALGEEALRASEQRFRSVLDASPTVVYLKDMQRRYIFVNRHMAEISGIPADRWEGRTAHELLPPELADQFEVNDRRVRETLVPSQFEEVATLLDREATYLSVQFPLFREDGKPYAICGISTDISDRKRAQWERDYLWENSPDPMCVGGFDGYLHQVNPAWTARLGWTAEELCSRPALEFVHPDDVAATIHAAERMMSDGSVSGFENRYRTREGTYRWFSWNSILLADRQAMYGFVRDITEERRLQEQVRQSQKIEAIGQLAGGIAHDFNNLLTVINGYAALLLGAPHLTESVREPLAAIRDAGDRAAGLTAQLLAFGRKAMVEPRVLDLNVVADGSSRMLRRLIGEDITLETELGASRAHVRIDPGQLEQVLMNLAVNARDAMPRGGRLRITTADATLTTSADELSEVPAGPYVRLTVSDTGEGMSEAVQSHIFEPFFTTKGLGKGTGLGLATVYGIVRQAGGTIRVDSGVGRGTSFHVFLPALDGPVGEAGARAGGVSPRGHEVVLIVEDEPSVRQFTMSALEAHGYEVHAASSPTEALRIAEGLGERVRLLITDVVMPGMGGGQLADTLRAAYPGLRVLFMSGYNDDAVVRHGVETATDAFLQKPFTPAALAARVRAVLDGRGAR
jgi:PAS domain S-box-containing protein